MTQSMLILVEDVNDNVPVFKSHPSSLSIREDAPPGTKVWNINMKCWKSSISGVIAKLEATDADEGPYGQVIYQPAPDVEKSLFSVSTVGDKAIVKLVGMDLFSRLGFQGFSFFHRLFSILGSLDYEKQTVHQVKVLAVDRAKEGRVNTGTAVILVKVLDVEDRPPEFLRVVPISRIAENSPIGSTVLQGEVNLT